TNFAKHNMKEAFDTIVAFGKNTQYPHYIPANVKKRKNEIILVDFGAEFDSYQSDLTRIFFLDKISKSKKLYYIYETVFEIKEELMKRVKAGVKASEIDKLARMLAKKKGFGKNYLHSTGHGVGLDIHEAPYVSMHSNEILNENMIITIEPGIYVKGLGGIRLEDTIRVTKTGYEILTK
ncbi:M24 family metallopeptidase, partial [bacterium]